MKALQLSLIMVTSLMLAFTATSDAISLERQAELRHLVKQDCGSCHGLQFKGGLGPPLLPQNLANKPEAFLAATILHGRPGTAMPSWKALLKPDEAQWIARLLSSGGIQ